MLPLSLDGVLAGRVGGGAARYDRGMCSNYRPVTRMDRLLTFFGVEYGRDQVERDVFPLGAAPFIRLSLEGRDAGRPALVAQDAQFGFVPRWATELKFGRRTYNARSETVATKAAFRDAWQRGQRCIIPAESIFEYCHETGSPVRWRISQDGDVPLGIAGVWSTWRAPDGRDFHTMAMLTVNADGHPLMSRMNGADDEKRMVVVLDPSDYLPWLACGVAEAPRWFRQWPGALRGAPDGLPRVVEAPKAQGEPARRVSPRPPPPVQGDLF